MDENECFRSCRNENLNRTKKIVLILNCAFQIEKKGFQIPRYVQNKKKEKRKREKENEKEKMENIRVLAISPKGRL